MRRSSGRSASGNRAARCEQHTYDFDAATGALTARRSKEEADDYRYFPEPDLVPVEPPRRARRGAACGGTRVAGGAHSPYRACARPRACDRARDRRPRPALGRDRRRRCRCGRRGERHREHAGRRRSRSGGRAGGRAREARRGARPDPANGLRRGDLEARANPDSRRTRTSRRKRSRIQRSSVRSSTRILEENPGQVAAYRGGKEGLLGFFVGQVMKETQGKADPRVVNELVREKLGS